MSVRFTAWLSPKEREAVRDKATEWNSSENYVVRMAVREFLGLHPAPVVTLGTRNEEGDS